MPRVDPVTVRAHRLGRPRRDPGGIEDGEGDRNARQYAGLAGHHAGHGPRVRRGGRGRRHVGPVPQILIKGAADDPFGVVGIQAGGEQSFGDHRVQGHAPTPAADRAARGWPACTRSTVWRA